MGHLREHLLDLYVLAPERLAVRVRERARHHLRRCRSCREREGFLRSFYGDLRNSGTGTAGEIERLMERVIPRGGFPALEGRREP